MKLEKAIEILTQYQKDADPVYLLDLPIAEKLLVEAGKRLQHYREHAVGVRVNLLPGETEE